MAAPAPYRAPVSAEPNRSPDTSPEVRPVNPYVQVETARLTPEVTDRD